jgi:two-component sensor histidine kinase
MQDSCGLDDRSIRPIAFEVIADDGTVLSRQAVGIGLLVTESVMNALKHAFPGERPDAAIVVSDRAAETEWRLTIADNGMEKSDPNGAPSKPGRSTSLIQALMKQLDAGVEPSAIYAARPCLLRTRHSKSKRLRRSRNPGCRQRKGW